MAGLTVAVCGGRLLLSGKEISPKQARALRAALKTADKLSRFRVDPEDCEHRWVDEEMFGVTDYLCSICGKEADAEEEAIITAKDGAK